MQIIGEKINGTRKQVAQAVATRDAEFIQNLARRQVDAGAHFLDINAGTHPGREPDDLVWLIQTVQEVVDVPLCLDSALAIGLLPRLPAARYVQVGNAAGVGAKMALLSLKERQRAQQIARRTNYIELTTYPGFSGRFARSLLFTPTER